MNTIIRFLRKPVVLTLAALSAAGEAAPLVAPASALYLALASATVLSVAPSAQALPADRIDGRQGARDSRQDGRQVSRARRRGCYALPAGAALYTYGGYRYYRVGPRFYYPYMYGGRTVYIDVDVVGGNPTPPPSPGSIDVDVYVR